MVETSASLLVRLREPGDGESWARFARLYTPLLRAWLARHQLGGADLEDLTQNILTVVARKVAGFEHNRRVGAFRTWLKAITLNCLRDFWRSERLRPRPAGQPSWPDLFEQMADPRGADTQWWDAEHDRHVAKQLLDLIEDQFAPQTWRAFTRLTLDEVPAEQVAKELGITPNAVYIAKSRVMARLRQEAEGLIDE